jgi:cytochrome c oxidase assembly protein subunit 15
MARRIPQSSRALHRCAVLTAAATLCLIVAGGLVTSTDSGLSVPDWPLSYGTWMPPMVGGIAIEHSHRMIAGVVGVLIGALAVWLWRREPRPWVRRLGAAAAGGVVVQALLGGLTVVLLLPPAVSVAHACLGQSVWCLTAVLALATSPCWPTAPAHPELAMRSRVLFGAAFAQLLLGAIMRHSGRLFWWHVGGAFAVVCAAAWALAGTAAGSGARRVAVGINALVAAQLLLGLSAVAASMHPLPTTAHVAVGALILAGASVLVALGGRPVASRAAVAAEACAS